jgi:hypothetical protein
MCDMTVDAMIGVIGGILVVLITLLIAMVMDLKKDLAKNDASTRDSFEKIRKELAGMVAWQDYKEDRKEVNIKLDEHGDRLLKLEIRVRVDKREDQNEKI